MNEKKREVKEVKQEVAIVVESAQPEVVASAAVETLTKIVEPQTTPALRHKALASLIKAERCGGKEIDHLIRQVGAKILNGENVRDSLVILYYALGELHSNADAEAHEHIGAAISALS